MRKSLVLTILAPAVLAADVALAAKSYSQCGAEFAVCQMRCAGKKVFRDVCFSRCESNRKTCEKNAPHDYVRKEMPQHWKGDNLCWGQVWGRLPHGRIRGSRAPSLSWTPDGNMTF